MLVIDASVAIKWVIQEPGTAEALELRRHQLLAPDLLIPECANVLWKKVRRGELTETEALSAGRLLEQANVDLLLTRNLLERATKLAITLNHPAYDCIYLAFAETFGLPLVTADEFLVRRVKTSDLKITVIPLASATEAILAYGDKP
jgi:predicted nucleic acid-binding protein